MNSSESRERKPNVVRDFIVGVFVTVVGGVIVAYIIKDAKFSTPTPNPSTPTQENQHIQSPAGTNLSLSECDPPSNLKLIELNRNTEPPWSRGIWGSENIKSLIVQNEEVGIIDTRDTDITEIQIWISLCEGLHGFTNGDRFWPLTPGVQSNSPPIYLGQLTIITITKDTGRWALGKR